MHSKESSFCANDLIGLKQTGEYSNSSQEWENHYQSTVVVPIRVRNPQTKSDNPGEFELIGFLCADSKDRNAFREPIKDSVISVMKGCADLVYYYLDMIGRIRENCASGKRANGKSQTPKKTASKKKT
jgi:hypothetical protein